MAKDKIYDDLDKSVVTKKAKEEMIDVHSQKYIKAWIDMSENKAKIAQFEEDWALVSPEAQKRVDGFIDQRLANPEGKMVPEAEIAHAVAIRLGMDTVTQNYKNACAEFDFYAKVIKLIQGI